MYYETEWLKKQELKEVKTVAILHVENANFLLKMHRWQCSWPIQIIFKSMTC